MDMIELDLGELIGGGSQGWRKQMERVRGTFGNWENQREIFLLGFRFSCQRERMDKEPTIRFYFQDQIFFLVIYLFIF